LLDERDGGSLHRDADIAVAGSFESPVLPASWIRWISESLEARLSIFGSEIEPVKLWLGSVNWRWDHLNLGAVRERCSVCMS
jgi:hypothetical protein